MNNILRYIYRSSTQISNIIKQLKKPQLQTQQYIEIDKELSQFLNEQNELDKEEITILKNKFKENFDRNVQGKDFLNCLFINQCQIAINQHQIQRLSGISEQSQQLLRENFQLTLYLYEKVNLLNMFNEKEKVLNALRAAQEQVDRTKNYLKDTNPDSIQIENILNQIEPVIQKQVQEHEKPQNEVDKLLAQANMYYTQNKITEAKFILQMIDQNEQLSKQQQLDFKLLNLVINEEKKYEEKEFQENPSSHAKYCQIISDKCKGNNDKQWLNWRMKSIEILKASNNPQVEMEQFNLVKMLIAAPYEIWHESFNEIAQDLIQQLLEKLREPLQIQFLYFCQGVFYQRNQQLNESINSALNSIKIAESISENIEICYCYYLLAQNYQQLNETQKAEQAIDSAIQKTKSSEAKLMYQKFKENL